MINKIILKTALFIFFCFFISCESDDISTLDESTVNVFKEAKEEDLLGTWAIFYVENNDVLAEAPINIEECGRDFFVYNDNIYEEFLFQESSTCTPLKNQLNWELNNGIISVSNSTEQDKLTILKLTENEFVFSTEIDINNDNNKELFTFTAYRYTPPKELDLYTSSFSRQEPFSSIKFKWNAYTGYNTFEKYEIYRAKGDFCNTDNAELIATITDINTQSYFDENPPENGEYCYFFRIHTDKGLLGTSNANHVSTTNIVPKNVKFTEHHVSENNEVQLFWEKSLDHYFSHYEIVVQDKNKNEKEKTVTIIDDVNTTSFTDLEPLYSSELRYTIYVYNVFGNNYKYNTDNVANVTLTYPEILDFSRINYITFDADEQAMFIYMFIDREYKLIKYDYINHKITNEAFKKPYSSTSVEMKLITSNNGKELLFSQSDELWVYNASDLTFKYSIEVEGKSDYEGVDLTPVYFNSFDYLGNHTWVFTNNDDVFTFTRQDNTLTNIDKSPHFPDHQSMYNYEITTINENNILVSHKYEGRAIHYTVDTNGLITNNGIKQIPLLAYNNSDITVNANTSYIYNKQRNSIYSSTTFSKIKDYSSPLTTLYIDKTGNNIYGVNNDLNNVHATRENFKREIIKYDIKNNTTTTIATKGFPIYINEDSSNHLVIMSSSFPRDHYYLTDGYGYDLFIETIKTP
ncbi:hypothetical protein AXE80_05135 [Wenyingzhuangia fucanilytica]|uniref:Fibronectin type-III domain-containing protein n=1 Tax=Wenyingzhuangia fucanilytica TaxID=1790137 RepID=A0A1B1Y4N5_9FLAO|nr:fibronectin type III domain-containing protein [Wenyingzhuangia fucanilytica]ANW95697.1 hypothetical protein AXE80_05135 [Wenyingzhuangia fucanilytica]